MRKLKALQEEPEPKYYATVRFHGHRVELWRASWRPSIKTACTVWYAKMDDQDQHEFQATRNTDPCAAIGLAILDRAENLDIAERLWSGIIKKAPKQY